jgi:hypothetical protein
VRAFVPIVQRHLTDSQLVMRGPIIGEPQLHFYGIRLRVRIVENDIDPATATGDVIVVQYADDLCWAFNTERMPNDSCVISGAAGEVWFGIASE